MESLNSAIRAALARLRDDDDGNKPGGEVPN
jgi:hypothetical protein